MKRINFYLSYASIFLFLMGIVACSRSTNSLSLSKKKEKGYSIREDIFNKASASMKGEVKFIRENRPSISYDEHVVWGFIDVVQPTNKNSVPHNVVFDISQKNASNYIQSISIYESDDVELHAQDYNVGSLTIKPGLKKAKVVFDRPIKYKNGHAKLIVSLYMRKSIPKDTKVEINPKGFFYTKGQSLYSAKIADSREPKYVPLVFNSSVPLVDYSWNKPMFNVGFLKLDKKKGYRNSQIDPSEFSHVILSDFKIATDNSIFLSDKGSFIVDQAELINSLHRKGVKVFIRLTAMVDNDNQQRLDYFTSLLSDEKHMKAFARELKQMLLRNNLDGVNLNFQMFKETGLNDKDHLCRFIDVIHQSFREEANYSLQVTANVTSNYRAWDYEELSKRTDFLTVMLYGFSRKFSAPLDIIKTRVKELKVKGIPAKKLIPIFPFYGNRWVVNKTNDRHLMLVGYVPMKLHKIYEDGDKKWHEKEQCYTYDYRDDKDWIRVYAEGERSIEAKLNYVKSQDLLGFGWYNLGLEAPEQAEMLTALFDKYNQL
ncbi:glycoside hydrolase family 18 protein [Halosquirtibacter xylanolyticus]|uniref:glycoside hydrolase family 18 protein n=1 Tax=Halosquirtibacter xylanolyticus TaxID=3374599 RepID=UPI00374979DC|nr:glycoside hydrolase family 18 protein [Prolixibacteraceae bacterium]